MSASPTHTRIEALDALRGLALFGVLLVNLLTIFRVSLFEQFLPSGEQFVVPDSSSADVWVAHANAILLEWKAVTVFSLLFGAGLQAIADRPLSSHRIGRRLAFLGAMGLVHQFLVWNGDILTLYAATGALAWLAVRAPLGALVALALGLFAIQLTVVWPPPFENLEEARRHVLAAREVYAHGRFVEVLSFRIAEVRPVSVLLLGIVPRTLGLMLLGMASWRAGLARGQHPIVLRFAAAFAFFVAPLIAWRRLRGEPPAPVDTVGNLMLGLSYASAAMLVLPSRRLSHVVKAMAPIGRLSLSNYLLQSLVLSTVFYGYGLGRFGQWGEAKAAAFGVAIFVVQGVASRIWLSRFCLGPLEWLWRSASEGSWQPLRA